ncbi:uncharacterized protein MEPE_01845 [Melanopsichium pennsylvanicum]|uniref:Uncharacterized protein n=2 Tax=Melanopsichium pennsylvanicum TaxID=63383 RepID=A0AAJ4XIC2_9BASI|nr:putative protein [Melanopsichium pennsylvanicum 4]SNX83139.1 uncharacterized protein MEPE_01845 [Melanopsichium pennsylvanicum]
MKAADMAQALTRLGSSNPFSAPASRPEELWQRLEARRPASLRFSLHLSRRPNASLCPCLEATIPSLIEPSKFHTITRILDPEHSIPYLTLSPLLLAAGHTIISGLLHFNLCSASYDLSLAGLEPWDDLWVSLPLARHLAAELRLSEVLAGILDVRTGPAWSCDEFDEGLSHNWRVPQEYVDSAAYSTDAITKSGMRFAGLQILPRGQQIKTLVSAELRETIRNNAAQRQRESSFVLHQKLVRWSSQLYSIWRDVDAMLNMMDGEGGEERGEMEGRARVLLEDLGGEMVPPTWCDMLEWMQLLSSKEREPSPSIFNRLKNVNANCLLSDVSLEELSELRAMDAIRSELMPLTADESSIDMLARLGVILQAKLTAFDRMNTLSLPLLSSSPDDSGPPEQRSLRNAESSSKSHTRTALPQSRAECQEEELARLHTKIDTLATKFDAFMHLHTAAKSDSTLFVKTSIDQRGKSGHSVRRKETQSEPLGETKLDLVNTTTVALNKIQTTPSLIIAFLSAALFLIMIKANSQ